MSDENPFAEAARKEVYYPDDHVEAPPYRLLSEEPVEADDVDNDDAKHGTWVRCKVGTADSAEEAWVAAPRSLLKFLGVKDAEPGFCFDVNDAKKRGNADDSPWSFTCEVIEE